VRSIFILIPRKNEEEKEDKGEISQMHLRRLYGPGISFVALRPLVP
jgi:hypothetical protein